MDTDERELLDRSVRHALASSSDVDEALEGIGWRDVLSAEPRDAVSVVFCLLGELNAPSSSLDDVMLDALAMAPSLGDALVLPGFARWEPPGTIRGDILEVDGLACARATRRETVAVPTRDGEAVIVAWVPKADLDCTVVHGIDPELGISRACIDGVRPRSTDALEPGAWEAALAAGRVALATELVAAGRAMLRLACEHALSREQFGRPIGSFQAVRHRLAEAYVALEAGDAAVVSAWDVPGPMTSMLAKSLAGRGARVAATHCQQVLAGIGFTTDHALHRYVKRVAVLDGLLGSSSSLPRELGTTLLATRELPRLLDL